MSNNTYTNVFISAFSEVKQLEKSNCVVITVGNTDLFIDEKPLEIKVGGNKVKVTTLEFMQAVKDMLISGVFELDQIDSEVWDIEKKLEVLGNQNDYLNETLQEIRGGC